MWDPPSSLRPVSRGQSKLQGIAHSTEYSWWSTPNAPLTSTAVPLNLWSEKRHRKGQRPYGKVKLAPSSEVRDASGTGSQAPWYAIDVELLSYTVV